MSISSSSSLASSATSPTGTTSSSTSWFSGIVRGRTYWSSSLKMSNNSEMVESDGPIKGKNQYRGVLFKYGPKPIQVAFKMGDYKQQVIFIGGMKDGFQATDYLEPLAIALDKEKWSLVQLLLSSSYGGYGTSSLQEDAMELDQLISFLINKENSEGVVLLCHSTGCQDIIVHYMRTNAACSRAVRAAILQAPVSDREYRATLPETAGMIDLASSMIAEGRGSELMPKEADPSSPITAYRFHSLCAYMGDDEMFSSDLTDDQLRMRLGHMSSTPCQVIFSMADEYVPEYVDKKSLVERWQTEFQLEYLFTFARSRLGDAVAIKYVVGLKGGKQLEYLFTFARSRLGDAVAIKYICGWSERWQTEFQLEYPFTFARSRLGDAVAIKYVVGPGLCRAMGGAEKVEIEHGNHSLSNRVGEAVQAIIDFVKREGPKGWDDPWN